MFSPKEFLHQEVQPALGCTEPGAVALAVSRACEEISHCREAAHVRVEVSDSIYKNGIGVCIPGVKGARGNVVAAALAVVCGKAGYGLEALKDCESEDVADALHMVRQGRVQITHDADQTGVFVKASVSVGQDKATCLIMRDHTNIVKVTKNEDVVFDLSEEPDAGAVLPISSQMEGLSYADLLGLVDEIDSDGQAYLIEGAQMNRKAAEVGLRGEAGVGRGFAQVLKELANEGAVNDDIGYRIRVHCYAAADVRMAGIKIPVMSSAGSGNHGITAILPVALLAEAQHSDDGDLARALFLSHLTTSFIKSKLGRLSPVCGCAVAAGAGAAAGMALLLGGREAEIEQAAIIVLANMAGMFCDGAKETCALKVGTAANEAYLAAQFAVHGMRIRHKQGVACGTLSETVENIARVSRDGMKSVDRIILDIVDHDAA
jgi:L-cysteine desulfidase